MPVNAANRVEAMPLELQELRARQERCRPSDALRGSVFRSVLEEVERRLVGDPRVAELRRRYGRSAAMDLFNYPATDWLELLWESCALLEASCGGPEEAMRLCGRAVAGSFLESVVGRLATSIGRNKGPIDLLFHAPAVYRAGANYGTRVPERIDARRGRLRVSGDFAPAAYHVGVLARGLENNGHKVDVQAKVYTLCDYDLEVHWLDAPAS